MAFLSTLNIIGSGMTAQQLRLDVISENVTNMNVTRTEEGEGAYRRKLTVLQSESGRNGFREAMIAAMDKAGYPYGTGGGVRQTYEEQSYRDQVGTGDGLTGGGRYHTAGGVRVAQVVEDESEMPLIYDPTHPDADENGYLEMPNVVLVKEVADAMAASQAFSADVTMFNTFKQVVAKGLEIGR